MSDDINDKIFSAFSLFDHEGNKTVSIKDIGTILRSLGLCPSESDLKAFVEQIDSNGIVQYDQFFPMVRDLMLNEKFDILTEEEIVQAFRTLDPNKTGFIDPEILKEYLMKEGEVFTEEEINQMISDAVDSSTGQINYYIYAGKLANVEPN